MTEQEYLFECVALKGQCPDCGVSSFALTNSYVRCRSCSSTFFVDNTSVQRVKIEKPKTNWDNVFKGLRIP